MAAQSLLVPSFAPVLPSNPKTLTLASSASLSFKPLLSSAPHLSFSASRNAALFRSSFVRSVALSSDVEQEEEEVEEVEVATGGAQPNFNADQKLFVGNLPFDVDSAELAELFDSAGTVEMVEVIYDKLSGRSRGFGFVTMSTNEEAEAAAQQFNGYELGGRNLRVNAGPPPPRDGPPPPRGPRPTGGSGSSNRVYVGNLPWSADNDSLESLFGEKGRVTEAKVVYDRETGRSRGFGFVTYSSAEEADSACSSLDGTDLDGRNIRVTIAEDRPRRQF